MNDNLLGSITDYRLQGFASGRDDEKKVFQFVAGLGITAAIAEKLLQSQGGVIRILPMLPERWPMGSVSGLVAQGGFVIDVEWHAGRIERGGIHSRLGHLGQIKVHPAPARISTAQAVRSVQLNSLPTGVIEFHTFAGRDYELAVR